MKKNIWLLTYLIGLAALMSFTFTDFEKTLIGKWKLQATQSPDKAAINVNEKFDMFYEFKSDFSYLESGDGANVKGKWRISDSIYLEMKHSTRDFTDKVKLTYIEPDKLEMTHPNNRKFIFTRVQY